jgi:2-methylaconitate cis-trans-isomerase PrpF
MLMSIALLIVGVVGLFQVLQTTRVAATGYDVSALEREQTALDADIRLLEAQIAAHSNLEQLREQATTRLGMVPADRQVHVSVDTPAPAIIPLPRRYVPEPERQDPPSIAWWEHVQARIPGLH